MLVLIHLHMNKLINIQQSTALITQLSRGRSQSSTFSIRVPETLRMEV